MLRKVFAAFMLFCSVGAFSVFGASAAEVEIVPVDSINLYSSSPYSSLLDQEVERDTTLSPFTTSNYVLGGSDLVPGSVYLYSTNANNRLDRVQEGNAPNMADWSMNYTNAVITLDMTDLTDGYYRYEVDLYIGVAGGFTSYANTSAALNLKASYPYISSPLYIGDSEDGMHCNVYLVGESVYSRTDSNTNGQVQTFNLIHVYITSTFNYSSVYSTEIVFNIKPWFDNNLGSLSFDCSGLRSSPSRTFAFYANNRFVSKLYGNVDPPVTPTPSPTPYPGQDTQESINAGVQQIVQDLNVYATPVPTPADIELDPDDLESLEALTLPDISDGSSTFSDLWDIFAPAVPYLTMLVLSLFGIMVFLWILEGRWF